MTSNCFVSVYYRVSINFTSLGFSAELGDRNSVAFQQLARELSEAIESLFRNTPGKQVVTILQFRCVHDLCNTIAVSDLKQNNLLQWMNWARSMVHVAR